MREGFRVGQTVYRADLRDAVEVEEATVAEVHDLRMRLVRERGTEWVLMRGMDAPWRGTRRAALERLRGEMERGVERCERELEEARAELGLVEAALSEEVGDA